LAVASAAPETTNVATTSRPARLPMMQSSVTCTSELRPGGVVGLEAAHRDLQQ